MKILKFLKDSNGRVWQFEYDLENGYLICSSASLKKDRYSISNQDITRSAQELIDEISIEA